MFSLCNKKGLLKHYYQKYGVFTVAAAINFLSYEKKLIVAATEVLEFGQQLSPSFCHFATLGVSLYLDSKIYTSFA